LELSFSTLTYQNPKYLALLAGMIAIAKEWIISPDGNKMSDDFSNCAYVVILIEPTWQDGKKK
jgi:hypothetical protein